MIVVSCKYAPIELFYGFSQTVEKLNPDVSSFSYAETCGHQNLCSYAKAMIETIHQNGIKELVLTDCCDSVRRSYDILKEKGQLDFLYLLPLPHKKGEKDILRFAKELEKLKNSYAGYSKIPFDLSKAVDAIQQLLNQSDEVNDVPHLRLAGAHGGICLKKSIFKVFPEVCIVDETCSGKRHLLGKLSSDSFFESYAYLLLNQKMPCMRMWFQGPRYENSQTIGTIYHTIKFCDYYHFDYMNEKQNQTAPMIKIETESIPAASGQLMTRLEAFKEELAMQQQSKPKKIEYVLGIDIGSTSTDFVIMNKQKEILSSAIMPTGVFAEETVRKGKAMVLNQANLQESDISLTVTTGYGRKTSGISDKSITEITCHAKGAYYLYPGIRTVIDIGGQDSKVIRLDENGKVMQFVMNDKCAAGTGRFLETQARALHLSLEDMSQLGLQWKKEISISSMCTVFAESEVISLIAEKNTPEDIIHGLNNAIASKTYSLLQRIDAKETYMMTGGVSKNKGVVTCLEKKLNTSIYVSDKSQLCGAIGAALLGLE